MNDPHVEELVYHIETGEGLNFQNPPPLEDETDVFRIILEDGVATFSMKEHYPTEESARRAVEGYLQSWELGRVCKPSMWMVSVLSMSRGDLTNEQWEYLRPLLPPQKPKTGRPAADHRTILNGILWILRTGAPWRDLPECYGPWRTVASRFYRWRKAGLWGRVLDAVQRRADATGQLDWTAHYVDSTIVRAHQHAAGAEQGDPATEALGRSQGGFSTKVHLRAEGGGKLITLVLTPGQQHEATVFEPLMERGKVKRGGRGRPKLRPHRVVGDKAYSSHKIRQYARRRGLGITIPRKRNECRMEPFDRAVYRTRNRIERLINRLKQFRRLATRYEKRAENYRAMWIIAAALLWL